MLEAVVECLVQSKKTTKDYIARGLILFLDIVVIVILVISFMLYVPFIGIIFVAIAVPITYFVFRNTNLEYEYAFFDGELNVDKIMNKRVRKKLGTFNFSRLEIMAPEDSERIKTGLNNRKQIDYSSHNPKDTAYVAVLYNDKNNLVELKFNPSEELLKSIQNKYSRKLYRD